MSVAGHASLVSRFRLSGGSAHRIRGKCHYAVNLGSAPLQAGSMPRLKRYECRAWVMHVVRGEEPGSRSAHSNGMIMTKAANINIARTGFATPRGVVLGGMMTGSALAKRRCLALSTNSPFRKRPHHCIDKSKPGHADHYLVTPEGRYRWRSLPFTDGCAISARTGSIKAIRAGSRRTTAISSTKPKSMSWPTVPL